MKRWILLAVLLPLATWALAKLADRLANRGGHETAVTRLLRLPHELRRQRGKRRGILART